MGIKSDYYEFLLAIVMTGEVILIYILYFSHLINMHIPADTVF